MSTLNFSDKDILITSSHSIDDKKIVEYKGFLVSDVVMGRHVGRDFLSGLRDFFGGRSGSWEKSLEQRQKEALGELAEKAKAIDADGIVGLRLEDEALGGANNMMNIKASGTAVSLSKEN